MSKAKIRSNLLDLVDSDSDDGLGTLGIASVTAKATGTRNAKQSSKTSADVAMPAAAKKGRGRAKAAANKVTKPAPKSKARRTSGRIAAAVERVDENGSLSRGSLSEEPSNVPPDKTQRAPAKGRKAAAARKEDKMELDPPVLATPPESEGAAGTTTEAKGRTGRGRPKKAVQEVASQETHPEKEIPDSTRRQRAAPAIAPAKRGGRKAAARAVEVEPPVEEETEIPETQEQPALEAMDVDPLDMTEEEVEDLPDRGSLEPLPSSRPVAATIPGSALHRPASSVTFDGGEIALRRRLGDMTRKCESLELKYRDLRDIAVKDAERNFDRLKKQGEEKANAANQLITNLKSELTAQRELARDAQRLRAQLETSQSRADQLQAQITGLTTQLAESKTEIKALSMKLAASRNAEAAAQAKFVSATVPGSAMKGAGSRGIPSSSSAGAIQQATQTAQMKENLYADLTGLIVRGVKREGDEDIYDCIQTGRNGTLHFKLSVTSDPGSDKYDEAQYLYMPHLTADFDKALIDVLPDYLVEEISFPRPQAHKFYARVMKALTERGE